MNEAMIAGLIYIVAGVILSLAGCYFRQKRWSWGYVEELKEGFGFYIGAALLWPFALDFLFFPTQYDIGSHFNNAIKEKGLDDE